MSSYNDPQAVAIRDAATVVLLADTAAGLSVWLQQRSSSLVFAAGMYAFPGGAVDTADRQQGSFGDLFERHAAAWRCDLDEAATLAAAAVRETQEESAVRLSVTDLTPWSRWVTPVGPPRRFDARFYVAQVPTGQTPRACTSEVHRAGWYVVADAVQQHHSGKLAMWSPTIATLEQLAGITNFSEVVAAAPALIEVVTE